MSYKVNVKNELRAKALRAYEIREIRAFFIYEIRIGSIQNKGKFHLEKNF